VSALVAPPISARVGAVVMWLTAIGVGVITLGMFQPAMMPGAPGWMGPAMIAYALALAVMGGVAMWRYWAYAGFATLYALGVLLVIWEARADAASFILLIPLVPMALGWAGWRAKRRRSGS